MSFSMNIFMMINVINFLLTPINENTLSKVSIYCVNAYFFDELLILRLIIKKEDFSKLLSSNNDYNNTLIYILF